MALIKCAECGKDLSDSAISCPHCGNPVKKEVKIHKHPVIKWIFRIILLILIILGATYYWYFYRPLQIMKACEIQAHNSVVLAVRGGMEFFGSGEYEKKILKDCWVENGIDMNNWVWALFK